MKVYVHRRQPDQVSAWLRDAGFTIEAQTLLNPDDNVPGALLFARRLRACDPSEVACCVQQGAGEPAQRQSG